MEHTQHSTTIVAALAFYALNSADPSPVYAALRDLYPDGDWSAWEATVELHRYKTRELQDGAR